MAVEEPLYTALGAVLFDGTGRVYTAGGVPLVPGDNVSCLMSEEAWRELCRRGRASAVGKLLVETCVGVMVVFCHLASEADLFPGLIYPISSAAEVCGGREFSSAPMAHEAGVSSADGSLAASLQAGVLSEAVKNAAGRGPALLCEYLNRWAVWLGRRVICSVSPGPDEDIHDFDGELFTAMSLHLLSLLPKSEDGEAAIQISSLKGRLVIQLSCDISTPRAFFFHGRRGSDRLLFCQRLADRRGIFFTYWTSAQGRLTVSFSPCDPHFDRFGVKQENGLRGRRRRRRGCLGRNACALRSGAERRSASRGAQIGASLRTSRGVLPVSDLKILRK